MGAEAGAASQRLGDDFFSTQSNRSKEIDKSYVDAGNSCSTKQTVIDIPSRQNLGGYLGVFGAAAQWLLKTESMPLALIAGLLGFGLLGAACSTFIRNYARRAGGEPLVPDLASVFIRGVSAAILIFLGVYGGLAVFSSGGAGPNPYVVLFTCLVAAVFSEDAWAWGGQRFRSQLAGAATQDRPSDRSDEQAGTRPG